MAAQHARLHAAQAELFFSSVQRVLPAQKWPDVPQKVEDDSAERSAAPLASPQAVLLFSSVRQI